MFEPSITSQILGAGGLVIGFFAAVVHANQAEKPRCSDECGFGKVLGG